MVYPIAKLTIIPFYKLWIRDINGLENIPQKGPIIIASNHTSFYDDLLSPVIIIPRINQYIHSIVNSRYWNNFFTAKFLDWGRSIPVYVDKDVKSTKKNKAAFQKALFYLKKGELIQIFPEGTRSIDGKLRKAKTGAARLSLQSGAPILPVGIMGSQEILPIGAKFIRFKRCNVKFGKLLYFKQNKNPTKKDLEITTRIIMNKIGSLIGQEYKF